MLRSTKLHRVQKTNTKFLVSNIQTRLLALVVRVTINKMANYTAVLRC